MLGSFGDKMGPADGSGEEKKVESKVILVFLT